MAYIITKNDYFQKQQPAKSEELINFIEVASNPLQIQDFEDEFYKTSNAIYIEDGETIIQECKYKEIPLMNPTATAYYVPETATTEDPAEGDELLYDDTTGLISSPVLSSSTEYYAWGAIVTVTNDYGADGFFIIVISGYPLKVTSKELMSAEDNSSITENGLMKYTYPDNHLIQSRLIAQDIAENLLDVYSLPRKDINIQWRGNPALELLDEIQAPEYQKGTINTQGLFYIYKQKLDYDGTLKGVIDGRKIPTTTTSTTTTLAP